MTEAFKEKIEQISDWCNATQEKITQQREKREQTDKNNPKR